MVKGEYVKLMLSGVKKATIRIGKVKLKYNEMIVHGGGRPIALIKIKSVKYKRVKELTDMDAKLDGFRSKEELVKELKKVYEDIKDDDWVTIIEFEIIKKLNELDVRDPWLGLKPVDIARIALRYDLGLTDREREILLDLTRTKSLRRTAINFFGTIEKRWIIRKILRKALNKLIEKGILKVK
ncbi:MAG TPA: ASCH domain-containing protein [Desulfurococcales archaeon]|nr:ASCH domain-containing protein [Desulfurococcales archaeon]